MACVIAFLYSAACYAGTCVNSHCTHAASVLDPWAVGPVTGDINNHNHSPGTTLNLSSGKGLATEREVRGSSLRTAQEGNSVEVFLVGISAVLK